MQRFYFKDLQKEDESITIKNPDLLNQLIKVLRVNIGQELIFFNGNENIDYIFSIKDIGKKDIYLEKVGYIIVDGEIEFDLNIFGAIQNKLEKIEYILEKGVEVGVTGFYFFRSQRSQKLIISPNKLERLNRIIIEAVEQSGRSRIPELIFEDDICLDDFGDNENIIFHTQDENSKSLKELKIDYRKGINLLIGPEGGFSEEEIKIFENKNFKKVYLGNRILRTETVGVVASFYLIQNYKK